MAIKGKPSLIVLKWGASNQIQAAAKTDDERRATLWDRLANSVNEGKQSNKTVEYL